MFNNKVDFFFSKLTPKEQKIYKQLKAAWLKHKYEIIIPFSINDINMRKVICAINDDNPELFYIDYDSISFASGLFKTMIYAKSKYDHKQCMLMNAQIENEINVIKTKCKNSDDTIRFLHDYITHNVKYADNRNGQHVHDAYGALVEKKAVCEGYARAAKLICNQLQIPCIFVSGTATDQHGVSEKHAWNIVKYKGLNFHIDYTWDSTLLNSYTLPLYFLVSDEFIRKDHIWDETIYPPCTSKGELEKSIYDIHGKNSMASTLESLFLKKTKTAILRFNKKFKDEKELMMILNNIIEKKLKINIASYSIIYIRTIDCAVMDFTY